MARGALSGYGFVTMKSKRISPSQAPNTTAPSAPMTERRPPAPPTQEQIAALAHAIWIDRGCPEGRDLDNWFEAERQLRGEVRNPAAADDIPADARALDPSAALQGRVERALNTTPAAPAPRSPTSL